MPQIFEIFGYPIDDTSPEAEVNRRAALCPFMARDCDGGGNRYLSKIQLSARQDLARMYPDREEIHAGVCSIQISPGTSPWIVCPRRLLVLGREKAGNRVCQRDTERIVVGMLDYSPGVRLGVWPEVKFKYKEIVGGVEMSFDYTFDYVVVPLGSVAVADLAMELTLKPRYLLGRLTKGGYTVAIRNGEEFVEDWPVGVPSIIEIMTSSTSGGNRKRRSGISHAFEDALLDRTHTSPGINYRQVWARMVSQLIVKSEIALEWGGRAIWLVQDVLIDYIRASTALDLKHFISQHPSAVNMLSFSYGPVPESPKGVIELSNPILYSGPIPSPLQAKDKTPSFADMIHAPSTPPVAELRQRLLKRAPSNEIRVN